MDKVIRVIILILIICLSLLFFYVVLFDNITFLGKRYRNTITNLDLSNLPINDDDSWEDALAQFKRLKRVTIKDKTIPISKKIQLEERYPNITFDIVTTVDVQGNTFKDNAEFIEIKNDNIDENIINELSYFKSLKQVKFSKKFTDKNIQLELMQKYPFVEFNWNVLIANKVENSMITKLDLSNTTINNVMDFKESLSLLPNLVYLDLSDTNLDNETLYNLRNDFPSIKIVWKIYFSVWSMKTDQVAFSVLIKNFNYYPLTEKDLELFKYCTDLQALDVGHQNITDISAIGKYLPNLRILILADNPVKDLTPLANLKHLHYLEIFLTNVRDLSPLAANKELVDLNISNNFINNIDVLLENDFPSLERLWMGNIYLKKKDSEALSIKYPNTEILNYGTGSTDFGWRTHERYYAMIDMYYKKNYISELFTKYDLPE